MNKHCDGHCHDCALADLAQPADAPRGWNLAGRTVIGFLVPLLLALTGAILWRHDSGAQFAAAAAGLLLGLALAALISRGSRHAREGRS